MSTPGTSEAVRSSATEEASPPSGDVLLHAFNALRDELVSTLMYVLGNRDDALDAAQDAFLKCWRSRGRLDGVQNVRAWIFRVALNTAKDLRRSAWHRKAMPLLGEDTMLVDRSTPAHDALADKEDLSRLRRAILTLREEEKEVFLLRQNGGFTYEQIAEIRHSPVGTVKTQMRAALQKLRKVLA
ncbi:MAG: RNA polymerase sigma factor [Gemmataceae bacterium]